MLDFRLLGPFEVFDGPNSIALGSPQQRFVLVALLLEPNRVVQRTRLIDMLWPDRAPASAHNAVQVYISRLRAILSRAAAEAVRIDTVGAGYRIVLDPQQVDAQRFRDLVAAARGRDCPDEAAVRLRAALDIWAGPPLADLDNAWLRRHACDVLEEARLDAEEELYAAELERGNHRLVLADLRRVHYQHPTRERLAGLFMTALYRAGRHAEALAVYRDVAHAYTRQWGIDPGGELVHLHRAILRNEPAEVAFSSRSINLQ